MKASETRELIDLSISVAFGNTKKDNKQLHELCQKTDEELDELERLAEIGRATEKAFEDGYLVLVDDYIQDSEQLIEWHKESEENNDLQKL